MRAQVVQHRLQLRDRRLGHREAGADQLGDAFLRRAVADHAGALRLVAQQRQTAQGLGLLQLGGAGLPAASPVVVEVGLAVVVETAARRRGEAHLQRVAVVDHLDLGAGLDQRDRQIGCVGPGRQRMADQRGGGSSQVDAQAAVGGVLADAARHRGVPRRQALGLGEAGQAHHLALAPAARALFLLERRDGAQRALRADVELPPQPRLGQRGAPGRAGRRAAADGGQRGQRHFPAGPRRRHEEPLRAGLVLDHRQRGVELLDQAQMAGRHQAAAQQRGGGLVVGVERGAFERGVFGRVALFGQPGAHQPAPPVERHHVGRAAVRAHQRQVTARLAQAHLQRQCHQAPGGVGAGTALAGFGQAELERDLPLRRLALRHQRQHIRRGQRQRQQALALAGVLLHLRQRLFVAGQRLRPIGLAAQARGVEHLRHRRPGRVLLHQRLHHGGDLVVAAGQQQGLGPVQAQRGEVEAGARCAGMGGRPAAPGQQRLGQAGRRQGGLRQPVAVELGQLVVEHLDLHGGVQVVEQGLVEHVEHGAAEHVLPAHAPGAAGFQALDLGRPVAAQQRQPCQRAAGFDGREMVVAARAAQAAEVFVAHQRGQQVGARVLVEQVAVDRAQHQRMDLPEARLGGGLGDPGLLGQQGQRHPHAVVGVAAVLAVAPAELDHQAHHPGARPGRGAQRQRVQGVQCVMGQARQVARDVEGRIGGGWGHGHGAGLSVVRGAPRIVQVPCWISSIL